MAGLLDLYAAQAGPAGPALIQPPSTAGERFSAEQGAATAPDRYFNLNASRREWFGKAAAELQAETGKTFANPYDPPTHEELFKDGVAVPPVQIETDRRNALIEANRQLREIKPDAIDAEGIDTFIGVAGDAARQKAAELSNTGNGLAAFAGGALALTPENVIGAMIPPGRAVLGATMVGRSFLGGVLREGGYQGVTQGALTAGAEGLDVLARRETGTAPDGGEIAANVALGVAGGAVLGAGFHALHAGPRALWERWNALPEPARANAPLEVRDAMATLQPEAIYRDANRLGLPWDLHERYQGRALDAVMRGQAVALDELQPGDMPMTGLATILRGAPDQIRVEGLGNTVPRIASLPDSEIEQLGRQLRPETFAPLDAIDQKLQALDQRTQAIHQEAQQIGLADVADIDTAARLQDIETRLQQKNLRKTVRADLERERETINQSIDPNGQLTEELKTTRRDFFPQHAEDLKAIETERAGLMQQREAAQSVAAREIEAMRKRLDSLPAGSQFGDEASPGLLGAEFGKPEDVAKALEAADFNRTVRMAQEIGPTATRAVEMPVPKETAGAAPVERPEIEAAAKAVMEGKGGALADFRKAVAKEMDGLDLELKDAQAAANCVANGGSIP